jgi:hypothetical protein
MNSHVLFVTVEIVDMVYKYSAKKIQHTIILIFLTIIVSGCSTVAPPTSGARPENWASPVTGVLGLPNLYRVNSTLYRSAQPLPEGFIFLGKQISLWNGDRPVKTVLSLRAFHDDADYIPASSSPLKLEQIRFKTWHPENEDVIKFLRIVTTPSLQPILVHCQHGSDRTGTMVAIYRIAFEGWTKKQATDEMINGGFGFHPMWQNLVSYIEGLDINAIKEQAIQQGHWN